MFQELKLRMHDWCAKCRDMPRVELPAHACAIFSVCWDWHHQLHALFNCNQLNRLKSIPHTDCSGTCQETLQLLQAPNSQTVAAGRQKYSCLVLKIIDSVVLQCEIVFPLDIEHSTSFESPGTRHEFYRCCRALRDAAGPHHAELYIILFGNVATLRAGRLLHRG
jgi:hypothetical protein